MNFCVHCPWLVLAALTRCCSGSLRSKPDRGIGGEVLIDPAADAKASERFDWTGPDNLLSAASSQEPRQRMDFSPIERRLILDMHNAYRSNASPPAADMAYLEWNEELASLASRWAYHCVFRHGFPPHAFEGGLGQNLYRGWDRSGHRAVRLWHDAEVMFYDYHRNTCQEGKVCGHYTQVMWSESRLVGCGAALCGNQYLIVCHYYPAGNAIGFRPYKLGKPCSQCTLGNGGYCAHNLCMGSRPCSRMLCECLLECQSCGELDPDSCTCRCKSGWDTLDCSWPCQDEHEWCGKNPGWPTPASSCSLMGGRVAKRMCRKMCGQCAPLSNKSFEMCCNGKQCPHGHALDTVDCRCVALHSSYLISGSSSRFEDMRLVWLMSSITFILHTFILLIVI